MINQAGINQAGVINEVRAESQQGCTRPEVSGDAAAQPVEVVFPSAEPAPCPFGMAAEGNTDRCDFCAFMQMCGRF